MKQLDPRAHGHRTGSRGLPILAACSAVLTVLLLLTVGSSSGNTSASLRQADRPILDQFDMVIGNAVSDALDGVLALDKVYWLSEDAQVAPKPDPDLGGTVHSAAEMKDILTDAKQRLQIDEMLFTEDTEILEGSEIRYYLDDTIFSVSWKQPVDGSVYSFAEVKVGHPSQFRRFLSGGKFGSGLLYTASDMAASVNAVTAASADFYGYRPQGCMIYQGELCKFEGTYLDVCFVDKNGDLHFEKAWSDTIATPEAVKEYIKKNDIRFSLTFGPILVENGEVSCPAAYPIGETDRYYSRAALCQQGPLHYIVVTVNSEPYYTQMSTVTQFAENLQAMGIQNAYTLDGGQTATLVSNNEVFNSISYGSERLISDIIYFATAIPDKE